MHFYGFFFYRKTFLKHWLNITCFYFNFKLIPAYKFQTYLESLIATNSCLSSCYSRTCRCSNPKAQSGTVSLDLKQESCSSERCQLHRNVAKDNRYFEFFSFSTTQFKAYKIAKTKQQTLKIIV